MQKAPYAARFLVFLFLHFWVLQNAFAQEGSFLYEISGNGLAKKSYVFGTIHVYDPRVFNFPTPLYEALNEADAFAMEVHPDSLLNEAVERSIRESPQLTLGDLLEPKQLEQLKKSLQGRFAKDLESLTLPELVRYIEQRQEIPRGENDMPAFMDMYLLSIAQSKGKVLRGLESVKEHFASLDRVREPEMILEMAMGMNRARLNLEEIVKSYTRQDSIGILKYISVMPAEMEAMVILQRNEIMVSSLEELMKNESVFAAVGVAHLPGENGVLQKLRNAGFTVRQLSGAQRLHASDYSWKPGTTQLNYVFQNQKEGYQLNMPGKPTLNESDDLKFYSAIDWGNTMVFQAMAVPLDLENDADVDGVLDFLIEAGVDEMNGRLEGLPKNVVYGGLGGKEVGVVMDDGSYLRGAYLYHQNTAYLLLISARKRDASDLAVAKEYFNSIKLMEPLPARFETFISDKFFFSVYMPEYPEETNLQTTDATTLDRYYFNDRKNGIEYFVMAGTCNEGYNYTEDSLIFKGMIEGMADNELNFHPNGHYLQFDGYPKLSLTGPETGKSYIYETIIRGNRTYYIAVFGDKQKLNLPQVDSFLSSFQFIPYPEKKSTVQATDNLVMPVFNHSAKVQFNSSTGDSTRVISYWANPAITFNSSIENVSHFEFASSDTQLLRKISSQINLEPGDSLLTRKYGEKNNSPWIEEVYKLGKSSQYWMQRITRYGDKLVRTELYMPRELVGSNTIHEAIEKVSPRFSIKPLTIAYPSLSHLLAAIPSMDTIELQNLSDEFADLIYEKQDIALLLNYIEKQKDFLNSNEILKEQAWSVIDAYADSSNLPAMLNIYNRGYSENRFRVLSWMADQESPMLFGEMKKLAPSAKMTEGHWLSLMDALISSERHAYLFPDWYGLLGDTLYGTGVVYLINNLRLSGTELPASLPASYLDNLQALSDRLLQNQDDEYYMVRNARTLLSELAALSTPEGYAAIREYFNLPAEFLGIKYLAAANLLGSGQLIPAEVAASLAGENYYRVEIQEYLESAGFSHLFPKQFANREKMSEAYVYNYDGDYFPDSLVFRGTHDVNFLGTKGRFYAYEAFFEGEGGSHPGFAGPFSTNGKEITMMENGMAIVLDKPFSKNTWKDDLVTWLKEVEKSIMEERENMEDENE